MHTYNPPPYGKLDDEPLPLQKQTTVVVTDGGGACSGSHMTMTSVPPPLPPTQPMGVVNVGMIKPSNFFGLAIFACLCCNPILGLIAIVMSSLSDDAYQDSNIDRARTYGKAALWLSISSISVGLIILVTWIIIFVIRISRDDGKGDPCCPDAYGGECTKETCLCTWRWQYAADGGGRCY